MLTAIKFDDSNILWFNWHTTNEKALENFYVTYFECKKRV